MKSAVGAEVQKGAKVGAIHQRCNGAKPYIGVAPLLHQNTRRRCNAKKIEELVGEVIEDLAKRLAKP